MVAAVVIGILGRYLARSVVRSVAMVALVLSGLYLSVDLVREAGDMTAGYGLLEILLFILRILPARLYDLFPFAVLIGGMLALGRLSANRELVAMRTGGFHQLRILGHALGPALLLGLAVMLAGEWLVPRLELDARIDRERARDGQVGGVSGQGLWIRDGRLMIQSGILLWNEADEVRFGDLRIYVLDDLNSIARIVHAGGARHEPGRWVLEDVTMLDARTANRTENLDQSVAMDSGLDPGVFRALVTRPRLLPIRDILRIQTYLETNGQDATAYRQAFWRRLLYPLNMLMMLFSGVALLLRAGRQLSPALGVFSGVSLGIGFVVVHRLVLGLAPVLPIPFGLTHLLPAAAFGLLALILLRR
ncbi:MAG TPA: LPS export ABC transporter permease LptG [Wenzhouxiangellaceae bacterium]|nr:LPS export ABC transporter permease LptG [Wenzhouxiangellaceae bacterium]